MSTHRHGHHLPGGDDRKREKSTKPPTAANATSVTRSIRSGHQQTQHPHCRHAILIGSKREGRGGDPTVPTKIHVLSFHLISILAVQGHAMNPYAVAWFNPVLDHFARCTIAHNLHHVIKKGYYTNFPYHHLLSASKRKRDISLYNKHMKTGFPVEV